MSEHDVPPALAAVTSAFSGRAVDVDSAWIGADVEVTTTGGDPLLVGRVIKQAVDGLIAIQTDEGRLSWHDPAIQAPDEIITTAALVIRQRGSGAPGDAEIVAAYRRGASMGELAEWFGRSTDTISRIVAAAGETRPARRRGQAVVYRRLLTKDWLVEQYVRRRRSVTDIAVEVGAGKGVVYTALRRHGIPTRGQPEGPRPDWTGVLDAEYLHAAYVEAGLTTSEIAAEVGCGPTTVQRALRRHGIDRRDPRSSDRHVYRDLDSASGRAIDVADAAWSSLSSAARRRKRAGVAAPSGRPRREFDVATVDRMRAAGQSFAAIADALGVSHTLVWRHCTGRR